MAVRCSVAFAAAPLPPFEDEIADVVLTESPSAVVVTATLNVQLPPAGIVAPLRLIWPVPTVAVIVPPPHEPLTPAGAIVIPAGGVGERDPVERDPVVLDIEARLDVPPTLIVEA